MTTAHSSPRTPKGKWEKAYDRSYWWFVLAGPVLGNLIPGLSFWPRILVAGTVMAAVTLVLFRRGQRERKARLARDAEELGLIECCLRYPQALPGSLRERWMPGTAQLDAGRIVFTPVLEEDGPPAGAAHNLAILGFLGSHDLPRQDRPPLRKNDPVIALTTDRGQVELAASADSLKVLIERVLRAGSE